MLGGKLGGRKRGFGKFPQTFPPKWKWKFYCLEKGVMKKIVTLKRWCADNEFRRHKDYILSCEKVTSANKSEKSRRRTTPLVRKTHCRQSNATLLSVGQARRRRLVCSNATVLKRWRQRRLHWYRQIGPTDLGLSLWYVRMVRKRVARQFYDLLELLRHDTIIPKETKINRERWPGVTNNTK